jgi:hypothetical protein
LNRATTTAARLQEKWDYNSRRSNWNGRNFSLALVILLFQGVHGSGDQDEVQAAAHSRKVHAFFYLWYGTPEVDRKWQHWNHEVLPHWDASVRDKYPSDGVRYVPPGDIHSPFYPMRGCYSSRDAQVTRDQLRELVSAGVGVVVLSWSGRPDLPGTHDTQGISTDSLIINVMNIAHEVGMEVALHLEPYHGRSALTVSEDFDYIIRKFGAHPALHRTSAGSAYGDARQLPVLYIYDSYRIAMRDWQQVLLPMRSKSVRSCACRCCFCVLTSARGTERETERLRNTHTHTHTHTNTLGLRHREGDIES